MNIIKYYFPISHLNEDIPTPMCHRYLLYNMKYDAESITYMSKRIDAEMITGIIIFNLVKLGLNCEDLIITDATAGIGGNTFSFATFFKSVNAIEYNANVCEMLSNNIAKCNYSNVTIVNENYITIMTELKQNIVFIDPPWGGRDYKKFDSILLKLSEINIEDICHKLLDTNMVVLKLPLNYNLTKIYENMCGNNIKVYVHKLKRMLIIVMFKENFNVLIRKP